MDQEGEDRDNAHKKCSVSIMEECKWVDWQKARPDPLFAFTKKKPPKGGFFRYCIGRNMARL